MIIRKEIHSSSSIVIHWSGGNIDIMETEPTIERPDDISRWKEISLLNNLFCLSDDEYISADIQLDGENWTKMPSFRYSLVEMNKRFILTKSVEKTVKDKAERLIRILVVCKNADCTCTQSSEKLRRSIGCYRVFYCNQNCFNEDWENHEQHCGNPLSWAQWTHTNKTISILFAGYYDNVIM